MRNEKIRVSVRPSAVSNQRKISMQTARLDDRTALIIPEGGEKGAESCPLISERLQIRIACRRARTEIHISTGAR